MNAATKQNANCPWNSEATTVRQKYHRPTKACRPSQRNVADGANVGDVDDAVGDGAAAAAAAAGGGDGGENVAVVVAAAAGEVSNVDDGGCSGRKSFPRPPTRWRIRFLLPSRARYHCCWHCYRRPRAHYYHRTTMDDTVMVNGHRHYDPRPVRTSRTAHYRHHRHGKNVVKVMETTHGDAIHRLLRILSRSKVILDLVVIGTVVVVVVAAVAAVAAAVNAFWMYEFFHHHHHHH